MSRTITIERPPMSPGQVEILDLLDSHSFGAFPCGRRWGKSIAKYWRLFSRSLETGGVSWDVWPNYPVSTPGWRTAQKWAVQIRAGYEGVQINKAERYIMLPGGGMFQIKTADDPTKLVAEGLVEAAVDEAAIVQERAWEESIQPALLDNDGGGSLWGVPKGKNWFYRRYLWGQDPKEPDWCSRRFSTFENPYLPKDAVRKLRERYKRGLIPEKVWQQEYLAQFIDDAGDVFRRVVEAATAVYQPEAIEGHEYVFGVDWGKHNDFTVIAVWDLKLKHLVCIDRFNKIDYTFQVQRLRAMHDRFRPLEIIAERNSMGEVLVEQLSRMDLPVRAFLTTNATKRDAIESLALAIERGDVAILPDDTLIGELQAYQMERLPSGLARYNAPSGMHDDCVMAGAIGHTGVTDGGMGAIVL